MRAYGEELNFLWVGEASGLRSPPVRAEESGHARTGTRGRCADLPGGLYSRFDRDVEAVSISAPSVPPVSKTGGTPIPNAVGHCKALTDKPASFDTSTTAAAPALPLTACDVSSVGVLRRTGSAAGGAGSNPATM